MEVTESDLPTIEIEKARDIVRTILYRFDGQITSESEDDLADAFGHKNADSGAFRSKLADLKKYDLIDGWGERELTERGRLLVDNEARVAREIIDEFPLFQAAFERFDTDLPDDQEWERFLANQNIALSEDGEKQTRKVFVALIRQLAVKKEHEPFSEEYFKKYYEGLKNDQKRQLCLQSLEGLTKKPVPSIEYFDNIFHLIDDDEFPEHTYSLLKILSQMCWESTEMVREKRHEETIELAIGFLEIEQSAELREKAIRILEAVDPSKAEQRYLDELWERTRTFAWQGTEKGDEDLQKQARQLFKFLTREWGDEILLRQMETDLFDSFDADNDHAKLAEQWHQVCREELGMH